MTANFDPSIDPVKYATHISVVTILGNIILSVLKAGAGFFGHSSALISDAVHSLSDVTSTFAVIIGVRIAHKESDEDHQYGHERLESMFAIVLAGFLMMVGIGIGFAGFDKIYTGEYLQATPPTSLALYGAILSILIKEAMYWYTKIAADKIQSDALLADAWHHRSDAFSSIGSIIGIVGAQLGYPILDPLASIIICFFIGHVSYEIFMTAMDKLTDKACEPEVAEKLEKNILMNYGVIKIDCLKTRQFSNKLYVDIEIAVKDTLSLLDAHEIAERVHDNLEKEFPEIKHCMVHVNPLNAHKATHTEGE